MQSHLGKAVSWDNSTKTLSISSLIDVYELQEVDERMAEEKSIYL